MPARNGYAPGRRPSPETKKPAVDQDRNDGDSAQRGSSPRRHPPSCSPEWCQAVRSPGFHDATSLERRTRRVADFRIVLRHNIEKGALMRQSIVLAVLAAAALPTFANAGDDQYATVQPEALQWRAAAAYAKGAQLAVIKGDPTREGPYVVRLKVPKDFTIAAHTHPHDENVTVMSGSFHIAAGDNYDEVKGETIKAGGCSFVAKGMIHYAFFPEETVIQLHGMGPRGITYVNPADDPRKQ
ncbi:MAG: cupin domain-containing protein [Pseudomonadota bacterium]